MKRVLLLGLGVLAACGAPEQPRPTAEGTTFGQFEVTASDPALEQLDGTVRVKVGGVAAYGVTRVDARTVRFTVQGAAQDGDADIVVSNKDSEAHAGFVRYHAPSDPHLARVVAFGASLTMGAQDANVSLRSQLHGPAVQFAKAAGAYLPVPLVKDGFMPGLTYDDFDKTSCAFKGSSIFGVIGERVQAQLLPKITDSEGQIRIFFARVDPEVEARNVAIGGFRIAHDVYGVNDTLMRGLEHFVWDPYVEPGKLFEDPAQKMLDRVEALQPTLVLTTDVFGNDYNNVDLDKDGIPDLSALTPLDEFKATLKVVIDRLDATGAEVFMATGPDATMLPRYAEKVAKLKAAGFSDADATSWVDGIKQRIADYNAELIAQTKDRPRFHVIDVHALVDDIFTHGVDVGGKHLTAKPFGGLLSLDSMHFSDTGYALLANEYVKRVNAELGTAIQEIDPAKVMETDPYSVSALQAAGFGCAGM